ncbi:MAG: TPR-repeat protein [Labilithrix sp.]|nr:TPR-repeat protein [Labilithrix sp.]
MAAVEDIIAEVIARTARAQQPVALCVAGEGLFASGDGDSALACFDRALRLDAGLARAWAGRASVLLTCGREGEALGCINRALDAEPGFAPALAVKGDMLRKRGVRDEALAAYERALAADDTLVDAWLSRATVLYDLGRMGEARYACERFLELAPKGHREIFGARMMMSDLEQTPAQAPKPPVAPGPPKASKKSVLPAARKSIRTAAAERIDPISEPVLEKAKKKSIREAPAARKSVRTAAGAANKAPPRTDGVTSADVAAFDDIRALSLANRHLEGLRKLEPIAKRCTESSEAWFLRAQLLFALKQNDAALTSIERAVRLRPDDLEAAKLNIRILTAANKDERALTIIERVLGVDPRDPEVHRMRADCLVELMRQAEAVFAYEKVIHHLPDDATAWLGLGRTLRQLRRFAEARMALTKARSLAEGAPEIAAQVNEIIAKLPAE